MPLNFSINKNNANVALPQEQRLNFNFRNSYNVAVGMEKALSPSLTARAGYMFLPASAKDFVPDGVVLRTPGFSIGPLDTFALWSSANIDPLVHRVVSLLKEVKKEL